MDVLRSLILLIPGYWVLYDMNEVGSWVMKSTHWRGTFKGAAKNHKFGVDCISQDRPSRPVKSDKYLVFILHQHPSQSAHVQ